MKGIRRVRQDGKVYRYHRATGIRLPDDIPEIDKQFLAAYLEAESALGTGSIKKKRPAAPAKHTLAYGLWLFCRSDDFLDLSDGHKENLNRHFDVITEKAGKFPFARLEDVHIQADIEDLDRNAGRMRLKAWRELMKFLKSKKKIERDPAKLVEMPKAGKPQKHKAWSPNQIKAFRVKWPTGTQQRLAMELMLFVGCRVCDAIRLGPGMIDKEGWLRFTQQKTGGEVEAPFARDLPEFAGHDAFNQLNVAIEARKHRHMTWLVTAYGSARSEKAASNWFSKACRAAGLENDDRRTAHGRRVTCATRMAERGASTHQIGAWTGHESLSEIENYTKTAARCALLGGNEKGTQIVQVVQS